MTNWQAEFEKHKAAERREILYWTLAWGTFGIVLDTVARMWWQP
ncbi:hypothetical protein [Sideroxydans lithotrophicus]|uniref:Uncharacterized protein n=1 Tax=Sideroxydans lithotrophicus (strain ES-1) TaxID=580332 RepID=D5CT88_SIDLE|nr:hypothetical protein [Sideroxydans lithotrophicus]ADE12174.1 hypothetical protein Slit_1945 [Sideroxydans lithotrophicus ES-1]